MLRALLLLSSFWSIVALLVAIWLGVQLNKPAPPLEFHVNPRWGDAPDSDVLNPIQVSVSETALADLRDRLLDYRSFEGLRDAGWDYGIPPQTMKTVVDYWVNDYKWREAEAKLNVFKQYQTNLHGLTVHYIHELAPESEAPVFPLLIVHGWPGSIWEFNKLIPILTKEGPVRFHVVAPCIPGFGFSSAPRVEGFDPVAAAQVMRDLMLRLGYDKFYVQGGDWGSFIVSYLSQLYPENVAGLHLNMATLIPGVPPTLAGRLPLMKLNVHWLAAYMAPTAVLGREAWKLNAEFLKYVLIQGSGYFHQQATRPDTLAVGLSDSPVGLAAWILEKFAVWSDHRLIGDEMGRRMLTKRFPKGWPAYKEDGQDELVYRNQIGIDDLLTNVMIYWVNNNIASSVRLYKEYVNSPFTNALDTSQIHVPAGVACFPEELSSAPRILAHYKYTKLVQYTDMPSGGHFAALEVPLLMADDIRSFVLNVEKISVPG